MIPRWIALVLALSCSNSAAAQKLFARAYFGGQQQLREIDAASGASSLFLSLPQRSMSIAAVDDVERKIYLQAIGGPGTDFQLFVVDLDSKVVTPTPFHSVNPLTYAYDPFSRWLLAVDDHAGHRYIMAIDAARGTATPIVQVPPETTHIVGFDFVQRQVYLSAFVDFDDLPVMIADLRTGSVITTAYRSKVPPSYLFDRMSGQLLGLLGYFSPPQHLARIDLATGATTPVVHLPGQPMQIVAFDGEQRRVFLQQFVGYNEWKLFVADLATNTLSQTAYETSMPVEYVFVPSARDVAPAIPTFSVVFRLLLIAAVGAVGYTLAKSAAA